jgi:hypothetical protein
VYKRSFVQLVITSILNANGLFSKAPKFEAPRTGIEPESPQASQGETVEG